MVSKLSFSAVLSTAVVGTVLMASVAVASPCPYKSWSNPTDSVTSNDPSSLTDNQLNANQPNFNKLGIVSAGFAALFGLYAGSTVLKARLAKRQTPDVAALPQSEAETAAGKFAELPTFPIVVPAEALTSADVEANSHPESVVTR